MHSTPSHVCACICRCVHSYVGPTHMHIEKALLNTYVYKRLRYPSYLSLQICPLFHLSSDWNLQAFHCFRYCRYMHLQHTLQPSLAFCHTSTSHVPISICPPLPYQPKGEQYSSLDGLVWTFNFDLLASLCVCVTTSVHYTVLIEYNWSYIHSVSLCLTFDLCMWTWNSPSLVKKALCVVVSPDLILWSRSTFPALMLLHAHLCMSIYIWLLFSGCIPWGTTAWHQHRPCLYMAPLRMSSPYNAQGIRVWRTHWI